MSTHPNCTCHDVGYPTVTCGRCRVTVGYPVNATREIIPPAHVIGVDLGFDDPVAAMVVAAVNPDGTTTGDPLDTEYDGLALRFLLKCFRLNQQENETSTFTPAQRAAISAHWSAQLRAKVQAGEAADQARRPSVVIGVDAEDLPW